jgi:hypothetical protein
MSKCLEYSIAVVSIAMLTCGCGFNRGGDRAPASSEAPVASQGRQQTVRLSGCVEVGGMAIADYVLRRVHIEGNDSDAEPRTTVNPAPAGIVEGSWVRLTGARDLAALAGHRVVVTGVVVDTGRNTVGTAGAASGVVLPSGDVSQASSSDRYWVKVKKEAGPIARESIANGTAPEIKVTEIKDLGKGCHGESEHR